VLGLLAPLVAGALSHFSPINLMLSGKPLTLYVVAGAINLLLARQFYRQGADQSANGTILITFVSTLLLILTDNVRIS